LPAVGQQLPGNPAASLMKDVCSAGQGKWMHLVPAGEEASVNLDGMNKSHCISSSCWGSKDWVQDYLEHVNADHQALLLMWASLMMLVRL
jgi:hypothetical protein